MNAETKDNSVHTWVDLLNSADTSGSSDGGRSRRVKISSRTPRSNRTASRLIGLPGHGEVGQAESLRVQVVALLKEKQDLRKKMEAEKSHRQRLEMELASSAHQGAAYKSPIPMVSSITKNGNVPENGLESSSMEIQRSSLQEALDQLTREKGVLVEQLHHERLQAGQLRSGLSDIESKMRVMSQRMKEKEMHCATLEEAMYRKSEQLDSMEGIQARIQKEMSTMASRFSQQPGLAPVVQQLEKMLQEIAQWVGSEGMVPPHLQQQPSEAEKQLGDQQQLVLELRRKVSDLEDQLARLGSERDALKERLGMVESQRQFAVSQHQEEVEARVLEVSSQLEELLQLNQQLQKELLSSQNEHEILMESLHNEMKATKLLSQENSNLQQTLSGQQHEKERINREMGELRVQVTSRQAIVERLQAQLKDAQSRTSEVVAKLQATQGKVYKLEEEDHRYAEAQHQLLAVRLEKDQLIQKLDSAQKQCTKLHGQYSQLENETTQLHNSLTQLQQEKTGMEAQLVTVQAELKASDQRCSHYQNEIRELHEFSQTRSRQQVEHLTKQLVDSARKLEESQLEKRQLQSRVKKLEGKMHEMALASEVSSSQLQKSMRTMATDFDSTLSDLDQSRSDNTILKKQVSELEMRLTETQQQLAEKDEMQKDLQSQLCQRAESISKLEATVSHMREETSKLAAASFAGASKSEEEEKLRNQNSCLLSQIQSLTNAVEQAQTEREALASKLSVQLEKCVAASCTEQNLREENSKLQELLSTTIDLSERLQSSLEQSQLDSSSKNHAHSSNLSDSLIEIKLTPDSPSPQLLSSNPPSGESPHLQALPSPRTEILHLQQKLAQARQSCLKLEALHASDQTKLAKAHGSLQALTKIQEHLSSENKSLTQTVSTMEKDREELRRDWQKATSKLETVRAELAAAHKEEADTRNGLLENLSQMIDHCPASSILHTHLSSHIQTLRSCPEYSCNQELSKVLDTLFSSALEHQQEAGSLHQLSQQLEQQIVAAKQESDQRRQQVASLESRYADISSHVNNMERELEVKEKKLKEKEDALADALVKRDRDDVSHIKIEGQVKDMETQYQAKLTVLRDSLISREQEVASLRHEVVDLQDSLSDSQHSLALAQEELQEAQREFHTSQSRLAQTEGLLRSEAKLLEEETSHLASETAALKAEVVEARESSELAQSVSAHHWGQVEGSEERISQLRGEVETLRARKTVLFRYLQSQEQLQDDSLLMERDQLAHESEQLMAENETLRAKLQLLVENSHHLQKEVESLASQLASESVDTSLPCESELALREEYQQQLDHEVSRITMEAEAANSILRQECAVLETELETERLHLRNVEGQMEAMTAELSKLRGQLRAAEVSQSQAASEMTMKIAERDASLAEMQSMLRKATLAKESLEGKLNDSSSDVSLDSSPNNFKKVDKLRAKLKQQTRQTNHLRMKLGYSLSELRLYKQLKHEMDGQISQLQEALCLSQDQYKQCIRKLENAENYTNSPLNDR